MEVILTDYVWSRMRAYVDNCNEEISGLGKIEKVNGDFRIVDIALFEQKVSATHSDIEAEALAKFQVDLIRKGEDMGAWCFWWHSHAKMDVFFSGTDTGTIDASTDFNYLVSLVTNHKHEFKARVDVFEHARLYKDIEVSIEESEDEDVIEACKAEIAEKVTRPSPIINYGKGKRVNYSNGYGGYNGDLDDDDDFLQSRFGFTSKGSGHNLPVPVVIEDLEALDEALQAVGTEQFARAIEVYFEMQIELEIEIDYAVQSGDGDKEKEKKNELLKLQAVGKEHNLDDYDTP